MLLRKKPGLSLQSDWKICAQGAVAMRIFCGRTVFGSFVALLLVLFGGHVLMAAEPYAVTATDVTMPKSGIGITDYTVSGIPINGTLTVGCTYSGPTTTAHIPICTYGPAHAPDPVTAGQTVTGSINFYPYGSAIPATAQSTKSAWPAGAVLAAGLLIGFGIRRKMPRWLAAVVLVAGIGGAIAVTGCGGGGNGMTPGTYSYTISATNGGELNPLLAEASTKISVTIP